MRIARVFPRRTKATPDDDLAFSGPPPMLLPEIDEVHVSVTFTYDQDQAQILAYQWGHIAPVKIGGPAWSGRGLDFVPGMYLKRGYVITSRGCDNNCWFCLVPKREGPLRELPITEGWNVQDDNLLACSEEHIRAVFAMLKRQPQRAEFTGGLEAARLEPWHVDLLADLKPAQMFFAYDTPNDYEPLVRAAAMLKEAGFTDHQMRVFVLTGYPRDTMTNAETRLRQCLDLGFMPFAMLYRNEAGEVKPEWQRFQRVWARPAAMRSAVKTGKPVDPDERKRRPAQEEVLPL